MEITVPALGEVQEVTVLQWLKGEGEEVEAGEAVVEVEADKAVFVVESPAAGRITRILIGAGDRARPGQPLAELQPP
jgi:pyruvate/2-oxoglutarate dehydrogenase complex dihydrolipoamide acyltransferase (E2) component